MNSYLVFALLIISTVGLNAIAQKLLKQRWILWLGYGIPFLVMTRFMWNTTVRHNDFFKAYYYAGKQVLQNPPSLYYTSGVEVCKGFVNIPLLAYLFTPLTIFGKSRAQLIFTILGLLAIITTCYLLIKVTKISGWKIIALIGIFVINGPLYYSVKIGNSTHFVLLLLVLAYYFHLIRQEMKSGFLLAISALIKVPLWFLGVYYIARRKWLIVAGYGGATVAIVGASLLLFGIDLHSAWYKECIAPFSNKPIAAYNIQSLNGFLVRLLLNPEIDSWQLIDVGWGFKITRVVLLCLLIGGTVFICWRSKPPTKVEEQNLEFSIVLCLALVTSPISWTHYYLLLLLPFSWYLGDKLAIPKGWQWSSLIWLSALLISPPVVNFTSKNTAFNLFLSKVLISHYFFGGVLLLGVLLAARWQNSNLHQLSQDNVDV